MTTDGTDRGVEDTLAVTPATSATIAPSAATTAPTSLPNYELGTLLGAGGMGDVLLGRDRRIGRDVAVKRMRGGNEEAAARFLREARIQARLEHPAIVPVYEIGHSADERPFFTMKRISGKTLAAALSAGASTQQLLRVFVDVCQAVQFAHSRGIVHRDLKPANIILGEFGEVYVLDWGLARVLAEGESTIAEDIESLPGMTQVGATLGTPGYMAPEQIRDAASVGTAADVYALGAILFEILARESLHVRGMSALASTVAGIDPSPAHRRPEAGIPPELDALCAEALVLESTARPTARALAERVQKYLDGDRDVARRKTLATEHIASARAALADDPAGRRIEAMRLAGSALALDPESSDAIELFAQIMLVPPPILPEQLSASLDASDTATQQRQARVAAASFIAVFAFLIALGVRGVISWPLWSSVVGLTAVMACFAWRLTKRSAGTRTMMLVAIGNASLAALLSRAFGSLIIVPSVTCVMALSLTSYPRLIARGRAVIAILVASWLVPIALERAGVLAPTWSVSNGIVRSMSTLVEIGGPSTTYLLVGANVIAIVVIGLFANALAASRRDAQRAVEIQAWHLRQLVPAR